MTVTAQNEVLKRVTVKTLTNAAHTFEFESLHTTTVLDLKSRIEECMGIPPARQRLAFRGRLVPNDTESLANYGVHDGDTLHLILALRGGGRQPTTRV
jgi:ubiquitin-like protein Nedd8